MINYGHLLQHFGINFPAKTLKRRIGVSISSPLESLSRNEVGHRLGFGGLRDFFLCSASLRWFAYSITIQNVTRHDLQFPKPWKLSSFAAFFGHFALSDDPLRVQKHATRSSPHISSRVRKRPFSGLQGERSQRSFSKVSKIYVTSTQPT